MMMLKTTALNAAHRTLGAKMVEFAGWEMPLSYGSQVEEHHRVRRDVGMFDVSHMLVIDLKGEGVRDFLRWLLANNVDRLQLPGKAMYSCMLNEQGGVLDDLIVCFLREDWFRMVVNAGTAEKDLAWIHRQRDARGSDVAIEPRRDLAIIAVQGPNARERVWLARPDLRAASASLKPFQAAGVGEWFVSRTGYTGEDGFEIILPANEAEDFWWLLYRLGVSPAGLGARDTLRLEAGMHLYGQDMDETTTPLESGLAWTVDLKSPRDFVGKAALEERPVTRNLYGLVLLDPGVLRSHQRVLTAHGEGETTSGSYAPTLNRSIAFARLPVAVQLNDLVQVAVRDKLLSAKVVKYPFVRNGKSLID